MAQPSLDTITLSPPTTNGSPSLSPTSSLSDWDISAQPSYMCSCSSPEMPFDMDTTALYDDEYPIIPGVPESFDFDFNFKTWPWSEPRITDDVLFPSLDSTEPYISPPYNLNSIPPCSQPPTSNSPCQISAAHPTHEKRDIAPMIEDQGTSPWAISSVSSKQSHIPHRHDPPEAEFSPSDESATDASWTGNKRGKMTRAAAHKLVEKKYRSNLNDKMLALRDSIPSLKMAAMSAGEDGDKQEHGRKLNKAYILTEAKNYIVYLKKRNDSLARKEKDLEARVKAFQMLSRSKYSSKMSN